LHGKNIMCDSTMTIFRPISDLAVLELVVNHVDYKEAVPITAKSDGGLHVSKGLETLDIASYLTYPRPLWADHSAAQIQRGARVDRQVSIVLEVLDEAQIVVG